MMIANIIIFSNSIAEHICTVVVMLNSVVCNTMKVMQYHRYLGDSTNISVATCTISFGI